MPWIVNFVIMLIAPVRSKFILLAAIAVVLFSCQGSGSQNEKKEESVNSSELNEVLLNKSAESGRYAWQQPSLVINLLGNLEDKVVADIGAGTGYFTFRLMQKATKVIAIDIDPNMLNLIDVFRENVDSLSQSKIETRLARPDNPNLRLEEVDIVVIINTIGFISDRTSYLTALKDKIKDGGELMIVDFKMKRIPSYIAPDPEYRVSLLELENALTETGYEVTLSDDRSLDYQYIVKATKK